ncbi:Glycine-rich RNA-binding protein 4, mitochondrial [Dendrobium catenatum]|uniref:Glycine-rich RNA-binding protein 4, mitochondrial n=1 Tax=Dendrobium catenatum TaxID=906689 RepID=A0A2I0WTQ2_9ASPA|nr:Glycine-rich RNA-binding protein 4, mitochondrial [Dendrobium catenatum]
MEIFKEAVVKNPSLLSRIMNEAETDPVNRNIFVHDLDWNATSEALAAAFSPFGQIEDCRVIKNQRTGRCKGHGYVLFRTRAAAKRALKDPLKIIGGRATKCRLASFAPYAAAVQARAPATVAGKNFRVGLLNPAAGLSPALSGRVAAVSHQPYTVGDAGIPPQSYAGRPVGSARGSVVSVNSISPSVIGNYGSLAALHGLGAYQNSAPSAAIRPQTGVGSWGASGLGPFYGQRQCHVSRIERGDDNAIVKVVFLPGLSRTKLDRPGTIGIGCEENSDREVLGKGRNLGLEVQYLISMHYIVHDYFDEKKEEKIVDAFLYIWMFLAALYFLSVCLNIKKKVLKQVPKLDPGFQVPSRLDASGIRSVLHDPELEGVTEDILALTVNRVEDEPGEMEPRGWTTRTAGAWTTWTARTLLPESLEAGLLEPLCLFVNCWTDGLLFVYLGLGNTGQTGRVGLTRTRSGHDFSVLFFPSIAMHCIVHDYFDEKKERRKNSGCISVYLDVFSSFVFSVCLFEYREESSEASSKTRSWISSSDVTRCERVSFQSGWVVTAMESQGIDVME